MKIILNLLLFTFFSLISWGQNLSYKDSAIIIDTVHYKVVVTSYLHNQLLWQTPASVSILNRNQLEQQSQTSLVTSLNTIPGVRMEERSPSSYRLSIRGSLVRSPYGVRNVKVYYNDFSLTDAGGNTYVNALNASDISSIEVLKGPDGSIFGTNSGGVVSLKSNDDSKENIGLKTYGGSYGQFGDAFYLKKQLGNHLLSFNQSYQKSDGYRQNSGSRRFFMQLDDKWTYNKNSGIEALVFYSNLHYETPGGLTKLQYDTAPKMARLATATLPSAIQQKAGVYSDMWYGGLHNKTTILKTVDFIALVWGSYVDFKNPFITNYEHRKEKDLGFRTFLSFHKNNIAYSKLRPSLDIGTEGQQLTSDIFNYDNNGGTSGNIQAYSNVISYQVFEFIRTRIEWSNKFVAELATSLNHNGYRFRDTTKINDKFNSVWMPHFAINYNIASFAVIRVTFSKGYSVPTTAEVRPNNIVFTNLQPEEGWNSELGLRLHFFQNRLILDASIYRYNLKDGIVSQEDNSGNSYFVNAGKINQTGVECAASWQILPSQKKGFFRELQWNCSYTYSHYLYGVYNVNGSDFSGNHVAGVPTHVLINSIQMAFPLKLNLFVQHNFTSSIPLNDANSAFAKKYHLLFARIGWGVNKKTSIINQLFFSVDNILNQKYSLGNDINAVGNRFYNAAPTRNFQLGITFVLKK